MLSTGRNRFHDPFLSRRKVLGSGTMTACSLALSGPQDPQTESLERYLNRLETEYQGTFAVQALRLDREGSFKLREEQVLPTASACKVFVLCELFRQAEEGTLDLSEPLSWKPEYHRPGDGVLRAMIPGQKLSLHNMAILMIMVSDNIATATLVDRLGPVKVTQTMRSWGLEHSNLYSGLPGGVNARRMKQPVSTARDMCHLMQLIYRHEVLTPASCKEIIRILRAQRCNDMMPRYIPVGEDWGHARTWIANKTGYGTCRVDAGLVQTQEMALSLALFFKPHQAPRNHLKCLADYPPVLAMAQASSAVYQHFSELE